MLFKKKLNFVLEKFSLKKEKLFFPIFHFLSLPFTPNYVPPHGATLLAHPEMDFYIVGMKSYGRAPTFLLATGFEQVRSVAAALAGDREAASAVHLTLPETGVCAAPAPVLVGFPTGLAHGRSAGN